VAERHPAPTALDQAGAAQRTERPQADAERGERSVGHRFGSAGEQVEELQGVVVEARRPGQHRVADRGRQAVARVREHRLDEERIAARDRVQARGLHAATVGDGGDGVDAQRLEGKAGGVGRARRVAEQCAEPMARPDLVVAVRRDDERTRAADPPHEEAQHVQRAVVGPLQVVDDENGGPGRECVEDRREHLVREGPGSEHLRNPAAQLDGGVVQRAERPRRPQWIAGAPGDGGVAAVEAVDEGPHQRRLADARLAADQHERAGARAGAPPAVGGGAQLGVALEQLHAAILVAAPIALTV
jgi:hypothetical protein